MSPSTGAAIASMRGSMPEDDRINDRLDARGDRINDRLDALAAKARAEGKIGLANHLDRKGDLIEAHLDRLGDRIENRLDQRGNRFENRLTAVATGSITDSIISASNRQRWNRN